MPNSKKPGKGTSKSSFSKTLGPGLRDYFVHHFLTQQAAWYLPSPPVITPCIYPGAVIFVDDEFDITDVTDSYCKIPRVLPPGVPLDPDLVDAILQHWKWLEDFKEQVLEDTALPFCVTSFEMQFARVVEQIYTEALWRKIVKTKPCPSSGT